MIVKGRNVQVNMQRRHLELIADIISSFPAKMPVNRDTIAATFASRLQAEGVNDKFNPSRFVKACVSE